MELKPYLTIEQYISNFPHSTQEKLNELRKLLNSIAPNAKEKISYGMPAFTLNGMFFYILQAIANTLVFIRE